jgi:hypothetical protein
MPKALTGSKGSKAGNKIPERYLPHTLSKKDTRKQREMLLLSRNDYPKKHYVTREKVSSFTSKPSKHVLHAKQLYKLETITPNATLVKATGCSLSALKKILRKGEGAYYSSGSRPNQTALSWGLARLASSITGGKAAAVDFAIIDKGCQHTKKAFKLAKKARELHLHVR